MYVQSDIKEEILDEYCEDVKTLVTELKKRVKFKKTSIIIRLSTFKQIRQAAQASMLIIMGHFLNTDV